MTLDVLGYTRATMAGTVGRDGAIPSQSSKTGPSSDCGLQLDHMKLESLVIVDQHATVNTFSSLVLTARQLKGVGGTRSAGLSCSKVNSITGSKS